MTEDFRDTTDSRNTTAVAFQPPPFNGTFVWISLALALALVSGVLVGAKLIFTRVAQQPVALTQLPSPLADSPECASLISSLPDNLAGHRRAKLAEPAPQGAAAWQTSSTQRVTLRCGVDAPAQYNEYSITENAAGAQWMRIDDSTPGSTLSTWFSVDRLPIVAVTADKESLGSNNPLDELNVAMLPQQQLPLAPAPLSQLASGSGEHCDDFLAALPQHLAEGFERTTANDPQTVVWVAAGREPLVVRCAVADPDNYEMGIQLYQVNEVTWFEDTTLANGTTSSTWFALGRATNIAASLPQAEGNEAVTRLSEVIAQTVPLR
ncbi:DUF3515 domain-containing protein [Corynebacterium mayonis]|uniref:DUF3515 domain-containing protein n=1 Tax=Corynebacterium mayonis TaxID=3062461 RepID=UPI0031407D1A